ncbi:hypothetical protein AVEN_132061-1 [Araneus ventricosus]|uniref:Uncharacterized protein n=1 Tax=Araneus ventricosus TaxID=182803 RepID=A0A4Y2S5Z6_ARAVE|nr:hypothetical protein AVEN_132061-1 [Araneus ventricosus]
MHKKNWQLKGRLWGDTKRSSTVEKPEIKQRHLARGGQPPDDLAVDLSSAEGGGGGGQGEKKRGSPSPQESAHIASSPSMPRP